MKLCLDEPYSPQIAEALRRAGHDVTSVKERPELVSLSDDDLLATMQAEQRALLAENVPDFAPLIATRGANGQSHHGIVYTSNSSMPRSKETIGIYVRALTELLEAHPADDAFVDTVHWL